MAGGGISLYRNHTDSDTTYSVLSDTSAALPTIEDLGWSAPSGYRFKEWNSKRDGTGTAYEPGTAYPTDTNIKYAIWEQPTKYLTTDTELTSVANAIRTKGGTSAALTYPAGFVSAIENIPSGGGSSATEYIVQQTQTIDVGGWRLACGYDLTAAAVPFESLDISNGSIVWIDFLQSCQLCVWEDANDDDEFYITVPSGTRAYATAISKSSTDTWFLKFPFMVDISQSPAYPFGWFECECSRAGSGFSVSQTAVVPMSSGDSAIQGIASCAVHHSGYNVSPSGSMHITGTDTQGFPGSELHILTF